MRASWLFALTTSSVLAACGDDPPSSCFPSPPTCPGLPQQLVGGDRGTVSIDFTITTSVALASLTASVAAAGGSMVVGETSRFGPDVYAEVDVRAAEVICGHGLVEQALGDGECAIPPTE